VLFLEHITKLELDFNVSDDMENNFDTMYTVLLALLDNFYLERSITVTSTNPKFITPTVKALLR